MRRRTVIGLAVGLLLASSAAIAARRWDGFVAPTPTALTLDDWRQRRPTTRVSPHIVALLQAQERGDLDAVPNQHQIMRRGDRIIITVRTMPGQAAEARAAITAAGAEVRGGIDNYLEFLADPDLDSIRKLAYAPSIAWLDLPIPPVLLHS